MTRPAVKPPKPGEGKLLVRELVADGGRDLSRCGFCGMPSPKRDGVCVGHADLGAAR